MLASLVHAGYDVRACVRNARDHKKVAHLNQMNHIEGGDGSVTLYEADMTVQGAYDEAFSGATCVFHVAAEMGNLPDSTSGDIVLKIASHEVIVVDLPLKRSFMGRTTMAHTPSRAWPTRPNAHG